MPRDPKRQATKNDSQTSTSVKHKVHHFLRWLAAALVLAQICQIGGKYRYVKLGFDRNIAYPRGNHSLQRSANVSPPLRLTMAMPPLVGSEGKREEGDEQEEKEKSGDANITSTFAETSEPSIAVADSNNHSWDVPIRPSENAEELALHEVVTNSSSSPLTCNGTSAGAAGGDTNCCATWDVYGDNWWLDHPDWEVSLENETHYCFSPMKDQAKANFIRSIHERQWNESLCPQMEKSVEQNSGFGASTSWLGYAFWHAHLQNKPFQIVNSGRRWLYTPDNRSSWAGCESQDTRCYYLPISPCPRNETIRGEHQAQRPNRSSEKTMREYYWILNHYLFRRRQQFRQKAFEMRQALHAQYPCTTMHIRRGDAGLPRQPYRRYAAVQEYIEAANISKGDNIVLLTDDVTTIEEVDRWYRDDYNWIYLNKTRVRATSAGFDGHIHSGDHAFEMLAIDTELRLASSCSKVVHGQSGFVKGLLEKMWLEKRNFTEYIVDTGMSPTEFGRLSETKEVRVARFFKEIEARHKGYILPKNPFHCSGAGNRRKCCGGWDINADDWWTHNPDWEVREENKEKQCFAPIRDYDEVVFMRKLYKQQWLNANCSELISSEQINSGMGAATNYIAYSFLAAHYQQKPFQLVNHTTPWIYGPRNKTSDFYCESEDMMCYYLPLGFCERESEMHGKRQWAYPDQNRTGANKPLFYEFELLKKYMLRPNQEFRKKAMEMRESLRVPLPCTAIHVRRGDAGFPRQPYRRYAAVQEYLDKGDVKEGENILLLTDDESTIEEIKTHHPNHKWYYLQRPRANGTDGGFEGHVPSGDPAFEMLAIDTEMKLGSRCSKLIHGKSGFMKMLKGIMKRDGRAYSEYEVDTHVSKEEASKWGGDPKGRVEQFMKDMEVYRNQSAARKEAEIQ